MRDWASILFVTCVGFLACGYVYFRVARPVIDAWRARQPVKTYLPVRRFHYVLPRADERTDQRTDEQTKPRTPRSLPTVDRNKARNIELLLTDGWTVAEIRAVVKGENAAIGQEIAAARQRLGLAAPEAPRTPYAGRAYNPVDYGEPDPALTYEAPPV